MRHLMTRLLTFFITACLLLSSFPAQAQTPQARIKIDTDRTIGEIHPH